MSSGARLPWSTIECRDRSAGARLTRPAQYDYAQIRLRLDTLRSLRARHDYQGLLFTLNEGIHGNMGGMGRHSLYTRAKFGTKTLIEQYLDEVDDSLRFLAELDDRRDRRSGKTRFFLSRQYLFRSLCADAQWWWCAGLLSPGCGEDPAGSGFAAPGNLRFECRGAGGGALGTHTDEELQRFYDPANVLIEAEREASAFSRMFFGANPQIDVGDLEKLVARMIPDMTFPGGLRKNRPADQYHGRAC